MDNPPGRSMSDRLLSVRSNVEYIISLVKDNASGSRPVYPESRVYEVATEALSDLDAYIFEVEKMVLFLGLKRDEFHGGAIHNE